MMRHLDPDDNGGGGGDDLDYYILSYQHKLNGKLNMSRISFETSADLKNVLGEVMVRIGKAHKSCIVPVFCQKVTKGQFDTITAWDRECSTTTGVKKE